MTPAILALMLGGAGLIVGSFLGLISLRLPRGENIILGRSRCGGCGRPLAPWRLAPVISYAVSRGRCAGCGSRIPARYPLMELTAAAVGVWGALSQPSPVAAGLTALLGWQLLLIAVIDAEHFWLPDRLTLPLLGTGLLAAVALDRIGPLDALLGAAIGFGALWSLALVYRRLRGRDGLGGGDPFLLGAGGAWVGWVGLPSVLLWAAAAGLSLVAARVLIGKPVSGGDRLPFGPCLALGIWLTWLAGPLGLFL
ncbi:A24 family peptidase [Brevundimonas sp.]|uniref:prepilin peptidase n=1 Tax=Brevundimonas sp. TaxID=1871086 RepID=UPI002737F1F3|nr:A24 family peptidase [Brevundimonas sp.]MDP3801828.1 prepilin peptidase [Brevundimonas sp.]